MEVAVPRYAHAREAARRLIERSGITIPPVNLYEIIEMCGLRHQEVNYFPDEIDALIIVRKKGAVAVTNVNQSDLRRRFSLAHELYHYLEEGGVSVLEDSQDTSQQAATRMTKAGKDPFEVEADIFAGELLVPQALLSKYVNRSNDARFVSMMFNVSEAVAAISLKDHQSDLPA
jgi:Zn-dependent peptidase ImmA (M78 family)